MLLKSGRSVRKLLRLLPRSRDLAYGLRGMSEQTALPLTTHLRLCGEWFLAAQRHSEDDGYSAFYSLTYGWARGYIETTGYIIPTMLDLGRTLRVTRYTDSAHRAAEWLLRHQRAEGAFPDIFEFEPQVFDTGQVLIGLHRMYRETSDACYLNAARRAADWLTGVQDADGSWSSMGYQRGKPATYHTRVAAALIECGQLAGERRFVEAGERNLRWAESQQLANGFFPHAELRPGHQPILHTLAYVLEGFLMAYELTQDREWLAALLRGAQPLKEINLRRDLVLHSQYDEQFRSANPEKCLTGLAQWALLCQELHRITGEETWQEAAVLTLYYLKSKQLRAPAVLRGALPGSVPLWGYYHPFDFVNWGVKFFADALLKMLLAELPAWREQEIWVKKCFELQSDGGGWAAHSGKLDVFDSLVMEQIETAIASTNRARPRVLDLGCGSGRCLNHLQQRRPDWELHGVDPGQDGEVAAIRGGSACRIPWPDESFDALYTYITLQHVSEPDIALAEIRRVLKPGGLLVICDRNPVSGRGLLKRWHEIRGRWMYSWDSPFRERWYTARGWKRMLAAAGFSVRQVRGLDSPGDRGVRRILPTNRFFLVNAVRSA